MDLAALKNELTIDPAALGYAAMIAAGNHNALATTLNLVRAGIAINRTIVPAYEIINATDAAEWTSATAAEKQRYQTIVGAGQVDLSNANVRAMFQAMFGAGTTTRAALMALLTRTGSRGEQLFGAGTVVTHVDILEALR